MFRNTKTDDGRLAELEATVANATQTLVDTKSATRVTWDKVKDIRAALEDSPDSPALAAGLREAEWKHREARTADERAHEALRAAERALVVALEAQPRAELTASLRARRKRIVALKDKLLPLLREFEAEILETHANNLLWSLPGGTQQIHLSLPDHLEFLIGHLELPGGLPKFLDLLDAYASGVESGERPASLGANFLKDKRQLAKAS